jgi:hypothetical protein
MKCIGHTHHVETISNVHGVLPSSNCHFFYFAACQGHQYMYLPVSFSCLLASQEYEDKMREKGEEPVMFR